jgi:hypothetical protein
MGRAKRYSPESRVPSPEQIELGGMGVYEMKFRAFPVFIPFLAMGFLDAEGLFVSLAKSGFHLSNAAAFHSIGWIEHVRPALHSGGNSSEPPRQKVRPYLGPCRGAIGMLSNRTAQGQWCRARLQSRHR